MSEEVAVEGEKVKGGKHRRRSSLSEAIQVADEHTHGSSPVHLLTETSSIPCKRCERRHSRPFVHFLAGMRL
jgi:hypothetical protein